MQSSVFSLTFQTLMHQPIVRNNWNNIFPPMLPLCSVTTGVVLEEEHQT